MVFDGAIHNPQGGNKEDFFAALRAFDETFPAVLPVWFLNNSRVDFLKFVFIKDRVGHLASYSGSHSGRSIMSFLHGSML